MVSPACARIGIAGTAVREQVVPTTATIVLSATIAWAAVWPSSAFEQPASSRTISILWPKSWPRSLAATSMPYSTSNPRKRVAPWNEFALAIRIGSPGATSLQPTLSALQIAAASTALPPALAAPDPDAPGLLDVHAAVTRSVAFKTALHLRNLSIH